MIDPKFANDMKSVLFSGIVQDPISRAYMQMKFKTELGAECKIAENGIITEVNVVDEAKYIEMRMKYE